MDVGEVRCEVLDLMNSFCVGSMAGFCEGCFLASTKSRVFLSGLLAISFTMQLVILTLL
jgi:hypothetical protein